MSLPAAINQSYPGWISRVDRIIRSCIGKDHNQLSFPFKDFYECAFSPEAVCLLALKYCEDKEIAYQNFPLWMRETRKYLKLFGNNCGRGSEGDTKLGNKFYHPLCPDNVGIDTNGRIVRQGISLLDGDYCWVLTYGCEAGKRMIPTVPPVPTSSIRDELRYVEYNNKTIIVGNTYLMTKISKPILSLFFALVPVGNIYLKS